MKKRSDLMNHISEINKNGISAAVYTGFSYLHIDLMVEGSPALWCAIACEEKFDETKQLDLKISDINNTVFKYDEKSKEIIRTLIEICHEIGVSKIHGRVAVATNYDALESFYKELGFEVVHTPHEKKFDSAKISMNL